MNSTKPLRNDPQRRPSELQQVRAEVARALSQAAPNEALLLAALVRVEKLLSEARADLSALLRELHVPAKLK